MRKLSAFLVIALTAVGLAGVPAQASVIPGGTGYVYHMGSPTDGKLMRYNIAEDIDEEISTADPSCAGMRVEYPNDIEFDATNQYFYWSADNWQSPYTWIARMNLRTGVCQKVAQATALNSNGLSPIWRGMDIDEARGKLFFVDNQGDPLGAEPNNYSLGVIDLNSLPATGVIAAGAQVMVPITMVAGEPTELNYANEILLDGNYVYIGGKNTSQSQIGGSNEQGVGIYKMQLFDGQGALLNTVEAYKVYSYVDPVENNPHIIKMELHNGFLYYSTFIWRVGGIHKVDLSTYTPGNPVTTHSDLITNTNTFDISYGFTFGFGDTVFASDRPVWPGPFKLIYVDGSANAPAVTSGTLIDGAYSDTNVYGQMSYRTDVGPAAPVLSTPVRSSDSAGTFSYTVANTSQDRELAFVATGSDSSTVTGTCTASPCALTGLTAGVTYSVAMRQRWMNGATELMHSAVSNTVSVPVPTVVPPVAGKFTKSVSGFATMKSSLTAPQKKVLRSWALAHGASTTVSCIGYVGHNWKAVSTKALKALGLARAKAACAYIHQVSPSVAVGKTSVVLTNSQNATIRKVVLTLK